MMERKPHANEVDNLISVDGETVFSIRKRADRNFEFYVERLMFDDEEEVYYWMQNILPRPHLFGSVVDAKSEIYAQFSNKLISN